MEATETLFEGTVPMAVAHGDAANTHANAGHAGYASHAHASAGYAGAAQGCTQAITVRLSLARVHAPQPRRVLLLCLTDDSDPFFYYSLEITEEDFQVLKNEQNLKPDFANFPSKMIELFQQCIACAKDKFPLYTAELSTTRGGQGQGTLAVVKTDDFKNLVPLSLALRPASDIILKRHLADQIRSFRALSSDLSNQLQETQVGLSKRAEMAEKRAAELARALDERVSESNRVIAEARAEMASHIAAEREKTLLTSQEISRKGEDDRKSLVTKYESTNASLLQTLHRVEGENKDLLDTRYRLEADVKDLTAQLHASKLELSHCKQELTALRAENKALDTAFQEQEKNANGHRIKISAVEQHILDKDELLSKMSALLDSSNAQKTSVEESLTLVKANLKDAEERVSSLRSEIKKGNQIIATLQTALKSSKSKSAKKGEMVHKLQAELTNKDSHINSLQGEIAKAQAQKETSHHEIDILRETEASLKQRLEECKQIIGNNNNVIEFLQKDLLKQKEGALPSTSGTSPYTFISGGGGEGLASSSPSAYKFRPKSVGYSPSAMPNVSSLNLNSNTPTPNLANQNTSNVLPNTTPATPHSSTSKNVLYNPPASQRRSFVQ